MLNVTMLLVILAVYFSVWTAATTDLIYSLLLLVKNRHSHQIGLSFSVKLNC